MGGTPFLFAPVGHMRYGIRYDRYEGAKRKILRYQGMWRKKRVELSFGASSVITNVHIDLSAIGFMLSIQRSGYGLAALRHPIL